MILYKVFKKCNFFVIIKIYYDVNGETHINLPNKYYRLINERITVEIY